MHRSGLINREVPSWAATNQAIRSSLLRVVRAGGKEERADTLGLGDQRKDMWILSINSRASIQIKDAMNLRG